MVELCDEGEVNHTLETEENWKEVRGGSACESRAAEVNLTVSEPGVG